MEWHNWSNHHFYINSTYFFFLAWCIQGIHSGNSFHNVTSSSDALSRIQDGNYNIFIPLTTEPSILLPEWQKAEYSPAAFLSRVKRHGPTRAPRPPQQMTTRKNDQRPKVRPPLKETQKYAPKQGPIESNKNIKFSTQHLFNPKKEAKKDGRKWDQNPNKWTKKQWNTFYSSRVKSEPGLKGKSVNTFIIASKRDFTKSVHKGEKLSSKDPKSNLHQTQGKFRAFTLGSNKKGEVKLTKAEFGKVVVGTDGKKNPVHFEKMGEGSKTINKDVKKWKDIKPKKEGPKAKIQKLGKTLGGNRNKGHSNKGHHKNKKH